MGGEAYSSCSHSGNKTGTQTIASNCEGRGVNENVTLNLIMAKWGVRRWFERIGSEWQKWKNNQLSVKLSYAD